MPSPFEPMACTVVLVYEGQHRLCVLPAGHDDRAHHRDRTGIQWDRHWNNRMEIYDRMCAQAGWREEPPEMDAWTRALYRRYRDENGFPVGSITEAAPVAVTVMVTGGTLDPDQPRTRAQRKKRKR